MKCVLLINPEEQPPEWPTMPRAVEPMGLLYVAGAFNMMNVAVDLVDLQLGYGDLTTTYKQAARKKYDGAGIAIVSQSCLESALHIAQQLKRVCATLPVFTGGVFASLNADWILKTSSAIDFVVVGEAEPFVVDIVTQQGKWDNIPNVISHDRRSKKSLLPAKLFAYPQVLPDRRLTHKVITRGEVPSIVASRGCGGGCSFCCISRYYGSRWQPRDVNDVYQELEDVAARFDVKRFYLVDDNLFGHTAHSQAWITSFLKAVGRFKPPFRFKTTCRVDDLDETFIPDIKAAGFDLLKIGIETFSQETQRIYKKRISQEEASRKLDALLKAGIGVSLGFIMFDPYCRVHDLWENLEFLAAYPDCWGRHLLRSRLIAYRGTRIARQLARDGLRVSMGISGADWRFRDQHTARIYHRFEELLRTHLLGLEWKFYNYQKALIKQGSAPSTPKELDMLLKECWIDLFKQALNSRDISDDLKNKLQQLAQHIREFCLA